MACVCVGVLFREIRRNNPQFLVSLLNRGARLESSKHIQKMGPAVARVGLRIGWIIVHCKRSPHTVPGLIHREAKRRWHDANYGVEISAQANTASNDRLVRAELRRPQRV